MEIALTSLDTEYSRPRACQSMYIRKMGIDKESSPFIAAKVQQNNVCKHKNWLH